MPVLVMSPTAKEFVPNRWYDCPNKKLTKPPRLNCAEYCTPTFARPPPSERSQPENLSTRNRLLSSKIRLCESSFGNFPIDDSLGRTISWAIGSTVWVPHECTAMNG